jgi:hypothetical protein
LTTVSPFALTPVTVKCTGKFATGFAAASRTVAFTVTGVPVVETICVLSSTSVEGSGAIAVWVALENGSPMSCTPSRSRSA